MKHQTHEAMLIRENVHNTAWWGEPVGVMESASLFRLDPAAQGAALQPFAWVEFKHPLDSGVPWPELARSGFVLVDIQIGFRLKLDTVPDAPSLADLVCEFAYDRGLDLLVPRHP